MIILVLVLSACDFKDTQAAINYDISLSADQETHAVTSSATGTASLRLVKEQRATYTANLLKITGTYTGLSGAALKAHLHGPAMIDADGPIIFALTIVEGTSPGTGTFSGEKDLTENQIQLYRSKQSYINIHTAKYPKGEIRGQAQ